MDPLNPESFTHKKAFVNGINLHYIDEGRDVNGVLILCHGFPDLWYGWRYQIKFLVQKGFQVLVPDLRGFGQSDAPRCPPNSFSAYSWKTIVTDLRDLMDALSIPRAIFIGHDWGGMVVWRMTGWYPERVIAVASFCTAYIPPSQTFHEINDVIKKYPSLSYQAYFCTDESEQELDSNPDLYFRISHRTSTKGDTVSFPQSFPIFPHYRDSEPTRSILLSQKEMDYYVDQYTQRGFHGGLNYYRTRRVNYEEELGLSRMINHPALMVTAGKDPAIPPRMAKDMPKYCSNLTMKHIQESGHWILIEQKEAVNSMLDEWLDGFEQKAKL